MGVLALHGQSYKAGQIAALDRHNFRLNKAYSNENINIEKTKDNITLIAPQNGLYKAVKARLEKEVIPYQKKIIRKDANWLAEFVVTVPSDIEGPDNIKRYCSVVVDHFSDKIGKENLISAVIHMDEATPHMHLDFTPITVDHRLSSKQIMTREFLTKLHDELPEILKKAGFEVERGTPVVAAEKAEKSRSIREYKKDMEKEKKELGRQIKALTLIKENLVEGNLDLAKRVLEKMKGRAQEHTR
ncbi:MobV family relaxase [Lachnoclostridium edouardi]|uniref:MobV family relaxase n=1 Tax=Lachnoclostridium edouardi TaxID=1926283 RepID=UPI000C7D53F7|nr:MobV family relaxase [Lachnoclostridium edouardi]